MQCWASQSASLRNFCARFLLNLGRTIFIVDIYTPPFRSCYPVNVNRYKVFGFSFHIGTEGGHTGHTGQLTHTPQSKSCSPQLPGPGPRTAITDVSILCQLCFVSHLTCSINEIMRSCDHQHPQWKTECKKSLQMIKQKLNLHFPSWNLSPKQAIVYTMDNERRPAEDRGYLLTRDNLNIGGNKMATYCKTLLLSLYIMKPDWEFQPI